MAIMHHPSCCHFPLGHSGHPHEPPAGVVTHFSYRVPDCADGGMKGVGVGMVVAPERAWRYGGSNAG